MHTLTTYQAGVLQASAHRALQKYCDNILSPYDITKMQWLIIGTILDAGRQGVKITDLAETLATTLPYLTNTINLLESKGMLERRADPKDERMKRVQVTPQFKKQCSVIEQTMRSRLRTAIYADVAPEEFRVYLNVLYKLGTFK